MQLHRQTHDYSGPLQVQCLFGSARGIESTGPDIGTVLNEEIVRLSRKECRQQVEPLKKSATQLRHEVGTLKRQVAQLERQVVMLSRKVLGAASVKVAADTKTARFSAKGLQAQRSRVALSATDFGKLLGVSAQSIYNWES
jgi:hypothetical protein